MLVPILFIIYRDSQKVGASFLYHAAVTDGGAYSPFRSILLVLTHDFYHHPALRTGGRRRTGWFERRGRWIAHHFRCHLRRRGCCMLGATSSQLTVPPHELPPARLVIHRQTSAQERRKGTWNVPSRSDILAHLCTRQHWLLVTVEPHIYRRAPRGGCCSGGRSLRSCTPSFGLGTTKP